MDSGFEDNDPLMNENLFEGDIMLPKGVSPRTKLDGGVELWPNKIVPYKMDNNLDRHARHQIYLAISRFHFDTCIKFVPKRRGDEDFIYFEQSKNPDNCAVQHIGKSLLGGKQKVFLGSDCGVGTIQHELMHSLGKVLLF